MWEWVKNHPYLTGGLTLALIVLFFVVRRAGGSSSAQPQAFQSGPTDAQLAAQVQTDAINSERLQHTADVQAALQAKGIDASTAQNIAQIQKDAALAAVQGQTDQANIALLGLQSQVTEQTKQQQIAANAQVAAISKQIEGATSMASIAAGAQVSIAGINAGVGLAQVNANLALGLDTNKTAIALRGIDSATAINLKNFDYLALIDTNKTGLAAHTLDINLGMLQSNNALTLGLQALGEDYQKAVLGRDISIAAINSNQAIAFHKDDTSVTIAGLSADLQKFIATTNAGVQIHGLDVLGGVYLAGIDAAKTVSITQLNNQSSIQTGILAFLQGGGFNKGGEGGANQVSIVGGLLGFPTLGNASQQVQGVNDQTNGIGGILAGVGGIIKSLAGPQNYFGFP